MSISRINNNVAAITATRHLDNTGNRLARNIERLSSGLRINRAGDDAAGLTIRERLRTQIRGTNMAIRNSQDAINMVNMTEASLDAMVSSLQRIRELAIQAGNTGTNDAPAIQAIQEEIFQHIDEVNRIAETARFSTRHLFTGDNSTTSEIRRGQDQFGIHISNDPNASSLRSGSSILNIIRTQEGSENLLPFKRENGQAVFATGIKDATDIAVTAGRFFTNVSLTTAAGFTSNLAGLFFDAVSINANNTIAFQGVLSDGVTPFAGALSVGANTMADLISQVQAAIDNAEIALWGGSELNIPSSFVQTHVSIPQASLLESEGSGRIRFISAKADGTTTTTDADTVEAPSFFNISFNIINNAGELKHSVVSTRDFVRGVDAGGQFGNQVQAITGSTFDTGSFNIEVIDIIPPHRRTVESTLSFRDSAGSILSRDISLAGRAILNGTFVGPIFTTADSGIRLEAGDVITIQGTNADGSTFETIFTLDTSTATDTTIGDGRFATLGGLLDEINNRDRTRGVNGTSAQSSFLDSRMTLTGDGKLRLIDDIADTSKTSFFMIVKDNNSTGTLTDRAQLIVEGNAEEATVSIGGGPRQRVRIGDQVELQGPAPTRFGQPLPRMLLRMGGGTRATLSDSIFVDGNDTVEVTAHAFIGRLNGGPAVAFQNGEQNVIFESGTSEGVAETLMLDFDAVLDVVGSTGAGAPALGVTVYISTVNNSLNFQVGAFKGQNLQINIPDMRADNLGFGRGSGKTIKDINITSVSGVNQALEIVDRALDQISRSRAALGAFTNRLETTIESLSVSEENLKTSESRISDIDLADEVTDFTSNQIVFQAGTSVLAQANFLPQGLLSLLG